MTRRGQEATAVLLSAVVHASVLCLPAASLLQAARPKEPLAVSLDLQGETRSAASEETGSGYSAGDHQPAGSEIAGPVEELSDSHPKQAQPQPREDRGPALPGVPEPEAVPPVAEELESLPPMPDPAPRVEEVDPEQPDLDSEADRRSADLEPAVGSPATSEADEGEGAAASEPEEVSHSDADGRSEAPERGRGKRRGKKRQAEESELLPAHLFAPKPPYPTRSRDLGEEGTVIIAILVGEDGRVVECRVASSSGHPLLDGSALSTVRQKWRFKAGRKAGEPVARWVRVPVEFRITER